MKNEFIGFYKPSENEINDAWTNGTFSFDANTLLNLYRYTEKTRSDFLQAIDTLKAKLFLPYQAAFEFHSNRHSVIDALESSYSNILDVFESNFTTIESQIKRYKRHPSINIANISKLYEPFFTEIKKELEAQRKKHPDFKNEDPILAKLTECFKDSIGKDFTKIELAKIFIEGKERFAESIPPGYKDQENKKKKGERNIYGDLIVWKELIHYCQVEKKPLIFVTDDRKEDWWTIENGKTIRPREELVKEFYDLTGIRILIYNADKFLQYAKEKKLVPKLADTTINEIKEVRFNDESLTKIFGLSGATYLPSTIANIISAENQFAKFTSPYDNLIKMTNPLSQHIATARLPYADILKANSLIANSYPGGAFANLQLTPEYFNQMQNLAITSPTEGMLSRIIQSSTNQKSESSEKKNQIEENTDTDSKTTNMESN